MIFLECLLLDNILDNSISTMTAAQSSAESAAAATANGLYPTEQTPLLAEEGQRPTDGERGEGGGEEGQGSNNPPVKEYSTRELVVIMSSIWLGTFLAALGMLAA